jgi:hypothetical protein
MAGSGVSFVSFVTFVVNAFPVFPALSVLNAASFSSSHTLAAQRIENEEKQWMQHTAGY